MEVSACQDRDRNLGLKVKYLESMNGVKNKEHVNRVENEFQHVSLGLNSHQSTRVENTGEQVPEVFAKITRGGQGFQEKLPRGGGGWVGGNPYFGFYCIFNNKCFEIFLRRVLYLPSLYTPHPPPPVCIYVSIFEQGSAFKSWSQ